MLAAGGALMSLLAGCETEEEVLLPGPTSETATPVASIAAISDLTPTATTPESRPPATPELTVPPASLTPESTPAAGSGRAPTRVPTPSPSPTPSSTPIPLPTSPLSGLTSTADVAGRRPIAVKIPNDLGSRPATGLSEAEVVYEHKTEGGITRFTAFFVLSELTKVGPIRSARFVDVDLIREYSALFAHVGGSPAVRRALTVLGDLDRDEFFYGADGPYFRTDDRIPPHNAYVDLTRLRIDAVSIGLAPLVDVSPWVFYKDSPDHGSVRSIHIPAPPSSNAYRVQYDYDRDARSYSRWIGDQPHIDELDGGQISVENVIVQFTETEPTQYIEDSLGNLSLAIRTVGEGRAVVFHDGRRIDGRWIRRELDSRTRFVDSSGSPIALRPGHSWVHLLDNREQILAG